MKAEILKIKDNAAVAQLANQAADKLARVPDLSQADFDKFVDGLTLDPDKAVDAELKKNLKEAFAKLKAQLSPKAGEALNLAATRALIARFEPSPSPSGSPAVVASVAPTPEVREVPPAIPVPSVTPVASTSPSPSASPSLNADQQKALEDALKKAGDEQAKQQKALADGLKKQLDDAKKEADAQKKAADDATKAQAKADQDKNDKLQKALDDALKGQDQGQGQGQGNGDDGGGQGGDNAANPGDSGGGDGGNGNGGGKDAASGKKSPSLGDLAGLLGGGKGDKSDDKKEGKDDKDSFSLPDRKPSDDGKKDETAKTDPTTSFPQADVKELNSAGGKPRGPGNQLWQSGTPTTPSAVQEPPSAGAYEPPGGAASEPAPKVGAPSSGAPAFAGNPFNVGTPPAGTGSPAFYNYTRSIGFAQGSGGGGAEPSGEGMENGNDEGGEIPLRPGAASPPIVMTNRTAGREPASLRKGIFGATSVSALCQGPQAKAIGICGNRSMHHASTKPGGNTIFNRI